MRSGHKRQSCFCNFDKSCLMLQPHPFTPNHPPLVLACSHALFTPSLSSTSLAIHTLTPQPQPITAPLLIGSFLIARHSDPQSSSPEFPMFQPPGSSLIRPVFPSIVPSPLCSVHSSHKWQPCCASSNTAFATPAPHMQSPTGITPCFPVLIAPPPP